jgi:hypothetical protein
MVKEDFEMRSLEYRSPRVHVEFGIDFIAGTDLFRGACVDVSEKGVRASFRQHVPMGKTGSLTLHHPECRMTIPARVVYLVKDQVGFAFFEHTLRDRELLSHLMSVLGIR